MCREVDGRTGNPRRGVEPVNNVCDLRFSQPPGSGNLAVRTPSGDHDCHQGCCHTQRYPPPLETLTRLAMNSPGMR